MTHSLSIEDDIDGDTLHEECGVFGILGHPDAATLTALGLHALQHRGQEAAGIVSFDGQRFHSERRMGLVGDHYTDPATLARLPGDRSMGHVRYSTTGETILRNVQPLFAELEVGGIAIAHNGNFTNGLTMRRQLIADGAIFQATSDTEVVLHLIARSKQASSSDRFIDAIRQMEGGYSMLAMTRTKLIAARDPIGIRPLVMGELDGKPIFCSETCALDIIGAKYVRDIENGEVVICEIQPDGSITIDARKPEVSKPERLCLFEYVYFARPDSVVGGRNVYVTRRNMGINLAREAPVEADVVVPVPDGGTPAAIGYAQESGIPFELGIIRNHYVGRTFIEPTQQIRAFGVKLKHSANRAIIEGKRVILVDDSIVRGTTSVKIVQMIRDAGALEVHVRVASPMIFHPDFYGIDTPDAEKLLANQYNSLKAMGDFIGADSLAFLSIDGLYRAVGGTPRDNAQPQFTDHYFTGDYPTRLLDRESTSNVRKLSMLASNG
ncbi:amidophosphoribosyltransferase [Agrobacterium sp. SHOUNA12C]|uniref:Amidophosphoribosyltransferase n=2 Tax=Rhizobium rhizogenes TaxID=359 RepID=B9JCA7_RHIR8|nr:MULTISPECIES: amidophosphoribosyltransferase [Rhizobium]ACM26028.1 amidophosphoribosyltransferase [Rhizobium rhizogenes K84]KAA6491151.1 amidophosphoribosyltransferase [Agrobacterium sp. ICMP 7243]MCJ9721646.1 amidophosphoribosyltransferase [Agrobacterium sp. BETTINA12B]MCJ9759507.1 amidophosphoribosyltransferase [Agrobacterium sp. SHOUNA12C]OCJ06608.1 amidophosphoribosyltransferase [Agrobacterium sp. 13-626]OCJ25125.1 amidophosphoribosyltransferase [Agrobacterium sp. B131/95]OCJ31719.1 a